MSEDVDILYIDWLEVGKAVMIWSDLVHQVMEKVKTIQERLKTSRDTRDPIQILGDET